MYVRVCACTSVCLRVHVFDACTYLTRFLTITYAVFMQVHDACMRSMQAIIVMQSGHAQHTLIGCRFFSSLFELKNGFVISSFGMF